MSTPPQLVRVPKQRPEPETVPLWEAAARTGLAERTIREAVKRDEFPGYMVGKRLVLPREGFDAFMQGTWTPRRSQIERELMDVVHRIIERHAMGGRRTA
jgi:excisionase family DNA binding protein